VLSSRTNWVNYHQKYLTILDFNEARDDGVAVASAEPFALHSRQITSPVPLYSIFTGRMLFLMSNRQCQSTEGSNEK